MRWSVQRDVIASKGGAPCRARGRRQLHQIRRCPEVSRDRRFTAFAASYRKQYTDPSREPTTTSPVGPMAGDEATGPSVAKDHTSVPSGDTA